MVLVMACVLVGTRATCIRCIGVLVSVLGEVSIVAWGEVHSCSGSVVVVGIIVVV